MESMTETTTHVVAEDRFTDRTGDRTSVEVTAFSNGNVHVWSYDAKTEEAVLVVLSSGQAERLQTLLAYR